MDVPLRARCDRTLQSLVNVWLRQRGGLPPPLCHVGHNLGNQSTPYKIVLERRTSPLQGSISLSILCFPDRFKIRMVFLVNHEHMSNCSIKGVYIMLKVNVSGRGCLISIG